MDATLSRPYQDVEHTADVALRVWGATPEDLFANAALGLAELTADERGPDLETWYDVSLEGPDMETLLVDWLNALIYLGEIHHCILDRFAFIALNPNSLQARVTGHRIRRLKKAVKAATFHNLEIERAANGLAVTVVFDV